MDTDQLAVKLQETTDRSVRNEGRIKKLERETGALHELATSMAVMAEKQGVISDNVDKLNEKVDTLEEKPGKRWDAIVDKVIWAVLAAVIAFILGRVGL